MFCANCGSQVNDRFCMACGRPAQAPPPAPPPQAPTNVHTKKDGVAQIVSLRCPGCGEARNEVGKELRFGAQFRCESCGSTSVLILDQQLVARAAIEERGEQVCVQYGRLAPCGGSEGRSREIHTREDE